ncbi:hypothetical protein PMAYCL1PPCAC_23147, partial [Pristionchus mayeri]
MNWGRDGSVIDRLAGWGYTVVIHDSSQDSDVRLLHLRQCFNDGHPASSTSEPPIIPLCHLFSLDHYEDSRAVFAIVVLEYSDDLLGLCPHSRLLLQFPDCSLLCRLSLLDSPTRDDPFLSVLPSTDQQQSRLPPLSSHANSRRSETESLMVPLSLSVRARLVRYAVVVHTTAGDRRRL